MIGDPDRPSSSTSTARTSSPGPSTPPVSLSSAIESAAKRLAGLDPVAIEVFTGRLERWWSDLTEGWMAVYAARPDAEASLDRLVEGLADRYRERRPTLRALDDERVRRPDWFQDPTMIGYVCYPARFGGDLAGVGEHLDYLEELRVRYLHLMPLLRARDGETDGGYAVADYRSVDPALGTMDDLERLCDDLRERAMSLCVDLVLNHTAAEHPWAVAARAGDPSATAMYRIFPDRTMPDRFERTLPETFPDLAPGNFTRLEDGRWVWTTFHAYQWDLDWSNPAVFIEMTDVLLNLANRGVEVFRLDAVAFMWKRMGTNCQNQPEVHDLLQALRACARIVAPAVVFKAEAIVAPGDLVAYLGIGRHRGRVSDMAYHNTLMVQFWSALATRDARLMAGVIGGLPRKPITTAWATYIRCHDDIGWAITDEDAATVGWGGAAHRLFLSSFYSGGFPGSFARGELFNYVPSSGDSRISGSFASLAGLEAALDADDPIAVTQAIERIRLGHALIMAWDGVPLLYMGDEIGSLNDRGYGSDVGHAADSRWLHRPAMDWVAAARRDVPATIEARIHGDLRRLIDARRVAPQMHASVPLEVVEMGDPALFAFARPHADGALFAIHNFADGARRIPAGRLAKIGAARTVDLLDPAASSARGPVTIPARGVRWLVGVGSPA